MQHFDDFDELFSSIHRLQFTFLLLESGGALRFIDWVLRLFLLGHLDELLEVVPHVPGVVEEEVLLHLLLRALRRTRRLPLPPPPRFLNKMGAN